jgi:dephospho-CoA kinase
MTKHTRSLIVGIAGGSGTGKTTVSEHLVTSYRAEHVDGDRIAHDVLQDPHVMRRVGGEFSGVVIDGVVDRRALGRLVFADQSRLDALNAIVHPEIIARSARAVEQARAAGAPMIVVDAALLLKVPMNLEFDLLLALVCDTEERVRRLLAQGHRSEAEIRDRIARQSGMEKHFYKADAVVDTGRDLSAVWADVDRLVRAARSRIEKEN